MNLHMLSYLCVNFHALVKLHDSYDMWPLTAMLTYRLRVIDDDDDDD